MSNLDTNDSYEQERLKRYEVMKTIFHKTDFELCNIPVPQGYKQSQTHVGVGVFKGDFLLTTSPYPAYSRPLWMVYLKAIIRKISGEKLFKPFIAEQWENPCLYISVDSGDGVPISFQLLQKTPLMPPPESYYGFPAYNSDPDLCVVDETLHVLNRTVFRVEKSQKGKQYKYFTQLFHIYGSIDNKRFKYRGTELLFETERNIVSPCITQYNGEYLLTELETNSYNDGESFTGLFMARSSSIDGFKYNPRWESVNVVSKGYLPWHMSLFQYDNVLYAIVACVKMGESHRCWQMLGKFSNDLTSLFIYQIPLTDLNSYRSAALVKDGIFILYNAVVKESFKGSKSVDGRDVIMAKMPFEHVIDVIERE